VSLESIRGEAVGVIAGVVPALVRVSDVPTDAHPGQPTRARRQLLARLQPGRPL